MLPSHDSRARLRQSNLFFLGDQEVHAVCSLDDVQQHLFARAIIEHGFGANLTANGLRTRAGFEIARRCKIRFELNHEGIGQACGDAFGDVQLEAAVLGGFSAELTGEFLCVFWVLDE
jgi:hypothetical protein